MIVKMYSPDGKATIGVHRTKVDEMSEKGWTKEPAVKKPANKKPSIKPQLKES